MWKDILLAMIPIVIPFIATYIVQLIKSISIKTENIYIEQISNVVADAVTYMSQTYVDELKKSGQFTMEAQEEAAKKALFACIDTMSNKCKNYLQKTYGDYTAFLIEKIEAEVKRQKSA